MSAEEERFVIPRRLPAVLEGRKLLDVYEEGGSWFMYCTVLARHCTRCDAVTSWTSYCDTGTSRGEACNVCNGTESRTTADPFAATMSEEEIRAVLAAHADPGGGPGA